MKKIEKNPVGRPRLADSETKKKAMIGIIVALLLIIILVISGVFTLTGGNLRRTSGLSSKSSGNQDKNKAVTTKTEKLNGCKITPNVGQAKSTYKVSCSSGFVATKVYYSIDGKGFKPLKSISAGILKYNYSVANRSIKFKVVYKSNKNSSGTKQYITSSKKILKKKINHADAINNAKEESYCKIYLTSLNGSNGKVSIRCGANAKPISLQIRNSEFGLQSKVLNEFNNHYGYVADNVLVSGIKTNEKSYLRLYYKYRNSSKVRVEDIAGDLTIDKTNVKQPVDKTIPIVEDEKCNITVSNVTSDSFKWNIKCGANAKPQSLRLTKTYNEKTGSLVRYIKSGWNNDYGYSKVGVTRKLTPNTDYEVYFYWGTKKTGYIRTVVPIKTSK